jgi:hypothetical protein
MPSRRTFLAALAATGVFGPSGVTGASGVTRASGASDATGASADSRSAASPPETAWSRTYAESASLAGLSAVVPREEGYVLLGVEGAAEYRGLAVRTDAVGRPRWTRRLGSPSSSFAAGAPHPEGGVVAAGTTNISDRSPARQTRLSADPWLVRLDEHGELVWARTLQPAAGAGGIEDLTRVGDGGGDDDGGDSDDYLVCGGSQRDAESVCRPWVARVTAAGHQRWARTVEGRYRRGNLNAVDAIGGDAVDTTEGDAVDADEGAVYVGGSTRPPESDDYGRSEDALVARLAPDGTTRWQYSADSSAADSSTADSKGSRIEALHADRDDSGVVAVGNRRFAYDDDGQGWHFSLDGTGEVEWERRHSTGPWNWLSDVAPTPEGYLLVGTREQATGGAESETNDGEDGAGDENGPRGAWVLRTDATGNLVRERTYYDGDHTEGSAVVHLDADEFLIAGASDAENREAGWLANVGGATPPNDRAAGDFLSDLADRIPPDADALGLGALLGAGAATAGRRLFGDD